MDTRTCRECALTQKVTAFPKAGVVKGKQYYRHLCGSCYVAAKRKRRHTVRERVQDYKKTLECAQCGIRDHRVIQFHHKGDKDFNISDGVKMGLSYGNILKEIKKCEVLCANCHQIEHYESGYGAA